MFTQNFICKKCKLGIYDGWCEPCQVKHLKENFINWTSGNEKIDNFIQEMQLKINKHDDTIVKWILYNQFIDIKEIGKDDDFATVYLAIWNDPPLYFKKEWIKDSNFKVALKSLNNSQNMIDKFLNEV